MCAQFHVSSNKFHVYFLCLCVLCLGSKLLYEIYKSAKQEDQEVDERDSLPRVESVL